MSQKLANFVKVRRQSPPSYLLHYALCLLVHVVISFCMAYSKHFLNDKRMYQLNFRLNSCQNQIIFFLTFLNIVFLPAAVPVGAIPIFLKYYTLRFGSFLLTDGEFHSLQFRHCFCFVFLSFSLLFSSLLVAYGISSIFFVFCKI